MFSFRQLFKSQNSTPSTNNRKYRCQSEPLESRAMLTSLGAGEAVEFESGDTSQWGPANQLVIDGSSTRGDANGFFDIFTELAPGAPADDYTGLELQGGQQGSEIGPSGEDVRGVANGFFDIFTELAPGEKLTVGGAAGSDTLVDPNDLVLRGLASIPLGIIDVGDLPGGIIDVGDLPDGIGPSGEDFQGDGFTGLELTIDGAGDTSVKQGDANGFFDIFTELKSRANANGFFDVFTELQSQLAGQEGQESPGILPGELVRETHGMPGEQAAVGDLDGDETTSY